jgi:hypothetical protein
MGKSSGYEVLSVPSVAMWCFHGLQGALKASNRVKGINTSFDVLIDSRGIYERVTRFPSVGTNSGRYKKIAQE